MVEFIINFRMLSRELINVIRFTRKKLDIIINKHILVSYIHRLVVQLYSQQIGTS